MNWSSQWRIIVAARKFVQAREETQQNPRRSDAKARQKLELRERETYVALLNALAEAES